MTTPRSTTTTAGAHAQAPRHTSVTDQDIYLFNEGTHYRLYQKLGAHLTMVGRTPGTHFAVWAPNARYVSVIGDFNNWTPAAHPMKPRDSSGIWELFIPHVEPGAIYKFHIVSNYDGFTVKKADPFGFRHEQPPRTASVVHELGYQWNDAGWMRYRGENHRLDRPVSVYEVHLGSWRAVPEQGNRPLTYRELAPLLAEYVSQMGFTHVEFLPVMEHPFGGSWGYQTTGYFAPTSRFGTPQDFMYLVDVLHQHGVGVILDWVPSHFPTDEHGLQFFDGTHLFEHSDPRLGFHPDWKSSIFNYGRNEVRSFLISSACFWFDMYHIDGLRVDAVASMLYRDYSRQEGEWIANEFGGRENLEAINFLRQLNAEIYRSFPDVQTIAEESTAWPMVSRPAYVGGLGFGYKWDMGWMHDTLVYFSRDPVHRKFHHNELTFRAIYQFAENYVLPLSHDEVVHGKGSLLARMSGDDWQKFANLRLLLSYQWSASGKKLLFMGSEIAQGREWNYETSVDWRLLEIDYHRHIQHLVRELNHLYRAEPALHELDCDPGGFTWLEPNDSDHSVYSYLRRGRDQQSVIAVVLNATPSPRLGYRIGVPLAGFWREIFNSDAHEFGGTGHGNFGGVPAEPTPYHGHPYSLVLTLPPLGAIMLRHGEAEGPATAVPG